MFSLVQNSEEAEFIYKFTNKNIEGSVRLESQTASTYFSISMSCATFGIFTHIELFVVFEIHITGHPVFYQVDSLIAQLVKNPPAVQETPVQFLGWEDPLEKG